MPDKPNGSKQALSGTSSRSNFASSKSIGSKSGWESPFLEHVEESMDLATSKIGHNSQLLLYSPGEIRVLKM